MACVCHSLAACQLHTLLSLAAVIGLSSNGAISLRCLRCVGWKPRFSARHVAITSHSFRLGVPGSNPGSRHYFIG